jgi:hypothetical protein
MQVVVQVVQAGAGAWCAAGGGRCVKAVCEARGGVCVKRVCGVGVGCR